MRVEEAHQQLTRRGFIEGVAASGLLVATGCRVLTKETPQQIPKASPTQTVVTAKQIELEKRFNVIFLTPEKNDELKLVDSIQVDRDPTKPKLVRPWDNARLTVFEEILPIVPESFYNPRIDRLETSWPLVLTLMSSTETARDFPIAGESRTNSATNPIIIFTQDAFRTDSQSRASTRSTILHEMTHKDLKNFRDAYDRFFRKPTGMTTEEDLDRVYASIIHPSHRTNRPQFGSYNAYGARNQEEHTAVAAEHYFLGEEAFMNGITRLGVPLEFQEMAQFGYLGYARFLGAEQAAVFYRTLKADLFKDREYKFQKLI
jgi:hypothetical protein